MNMNTSIETSPEKTNSEVSMQVIGISDFGMELLKRPDLYRLPEIAFSSVSNNETRELIQAQIINAPLVFIIADASDSAALKCAATIGNIANQREILSIVPLVYSDPDLQPSQGLEIAQSMIGQHVDSILEPYLPLGPLQTSATDHQWHKVNDLACAAIVAIASSVATPGMINVDIEDIRNVIFPTRGSIKITVATATGKQRAWQAVLKALAAILPSASHTHMLGEVFIHLASANDLKLKEVAAVLSHFDHARCKPYVIVAVTTDANLGNQLRATVFARGSAK